jgi:phosphoribosylformylglycinamidine synthase
MSEQPIVDLDLALARGLTAEEYDTLCKGLGRTPTYTELGITAALWSEHCSYKSSRIYLREFPTDGPSVVQGPGENAGIVDLGHGWVAAFKMESHNHPSYLEPFQGAATGVGGILRDVFTMGARPIALLDSLRFGRPDTPKMRHLIDGVVRGISHYGNCVGVPTVGGETGFHSCYDGNILVNVFALGVARRERIFRARAVGPGNPILYVGSKTGRDGVHGATMASESFGEDGADKRPTVQVGDPFTEKVLLEACLQAVRTGCVVALQDMGAAGLTSSTFEMASRGGTGLVLELDRVPLREKGLSAYEIMLSESQERMVFVARQGREDEVIRIFDRWGLDAVRIGKVADGNRAVISHHGEVVADLPIALLTDEAPHYRRPAEPPKDLAARQADPEIPEPKDTGAALLDLMGTPELGDTSWIWRQYDHSVRASTVIGPGGDAAVVALKGTPLGIAMSTDVNPVYCHLDPRTGGAQAVAEAVRNLACVGAEPLGMTDCLNFGNPELPEVSWALRECVRGMSLASRALECPVVSGNVSLYNDTAGRSIYPTPTVAVVGVIPDLVKLPKAHFSEAGGRIVLLGEDHRELGGSAYLRLLHGIEQGKPPRVDLEAERRLGDLLRLLVFEGILDTAHDLGTGGLAIALAEATFAKGLGCHVRVPLDPVALFSESQARAFIAVPAGELDAVLLSAEEAGVPALEIGEVGGHRLLVEADGDRIDLEVGALRARWEQALPSALGL